MNPILDALNRANVSPPLKSVSLPVQLDPPQDFQHRLLMAEIHIRSQLSDALQSSVTVAYDSTGTIGGAAATATLVTGEIVALTKDEWHRVLRELYRAGVEVGRNGRPQQENAPCQLEEPTATPPQPHSPAGPSTI